MTARHDGLGERRRRTPVAAEAVTRPAACLLRCCPCQAESSERPLRRRAARMARPARVRMRSRKPWVFARRRLFGWKVRLLTRGLQWGGRKCGHDCGHVEAHVAPTTH
jgi:hypothetical protein